ncbi:toll/interleukin-1 receptor domain-containing protein [Aliiglaciecola sp. CAU 1673]|uniref:toll/interleukin-1 receptor domain-containing protein n=1 Tax=Aliiglaciecola sp. CAU 1673 TaxID=3032595 RepID=UPI0023D9BC58|nr:toll/interleukin-1 receptor domain-containing protein [Aliiglaciecola sp. CAU 1673]MDF2180119.1 toll/interleukin-1 receptor domain-containing protein [Aliiglaciecola sp. CAU 1673]
MSSYRYKAFISYSHKDSKWAHWLHKELERFHVHKHLIGQETPAGKVPDKLLPVFLDREELASATDLGTLLTECLENSWCQIVICSPTAAKSRWVNEEILTFKRLGKAHRIFSLIVDGEPYASDSNQPDQECFPPALRFHLDEHGQLSDRPAEPIAADARPGKDGKRNALYKIVAGMLGVGFDTLKQRELQRRQKRMALITAGTTLGMVLAIGLAVDAMIARNEAQQQRNRAEIEAQTANRTANFMVSLFSVSDPSEARGNTITAREILDNGAHRIEDELSDEPQIQATLMNTIGQVYTALGLYQRAADLLESALKVRQALRAEDKISAAELSDSMDALARIYTELASYEEAEALFKRAMMLLELQGKPTSKLAADIKAGLAELYFRMGRYTDAEPLLQQVLTLRRLNHGEQSLEAAQATQQLGLNLLDQGELEKAESYLRDAMAQMQTVLGNEPHPALAENYNNLAYVLHSMGRFEEARTQYERALEMHRVLLGEDHPDVATAHINLAMLYQDSGRYDQAKEMFEASIKILHRVYGEAHPKIAKAMNNLAYLLYDQNDAEGALRIMEKVVEMARATLGDQHADLARYLSTEGRWLAESGRHEEAVAIHRRALAMKIHMLGEDHPNVAISEFDLAESLLGIGQNQEALSLAQHAVKALIEAHGEEHWYVAIAKLTLARALMAQNALQEAEPMLLKSYAQLEADEYIPPAYLRRALQRLVELYTLKNASAERDKFKLLLANMGA